MRAALVIVTIAVAACGGNAKRPAQPVSNEASPPAAGPNTFDARHAQLSSIADQVCACADAECALNAMEPLNTFPMSGAEGETETAAQRNALADAADRALGCIDRLSAAANKP